MLFRRPHSAIRVLLLCLVPLAGLRAQRDLQQIPDPDPAKERAAFRLAPEIEVNLFVSDPQIAKPIQMNFDAEGKLWIASSEVYPHIKPGQKPTDKILVVEDTNHDGVADKTTVFADRLLIPTGVLPGDGGVYVANSTELVHLRDTDGDGKADRRRVVLSGFGTEDTHHLLHTLRWGPDGCLYMNQSIYIHSHVETPWGVRHLNGGGIWRFRPEAMRLDIFCRGFINPWGHHFDRWGQSFVTDGAYREGINFAFPGAVFVSSPGAERIVRGLNPGSPKHCGLEILSGRHVPPSWVGQMITNDFRGNRVCRFRVSEHGSGYVSRQLPELITTDHVAFRPVDVKMGPDGAIYIADWYNPIIQHGEVDFRDPRRDHRRGRIWRITFRGRATLRAPRIVGAPIEALVELLEAPEQWTRLHAKLELKTRPSAEVRQALAAWVAKLDPDSPDYLHHCLEALWAGEAVSEVDTELLDRLLVCRDGRVRAAALRVWSHLPPPRSESARSTRPDVSDPRHRDILPTAADDAARKILRRAVADSHPRVRLEALGILAELDDIRATDLALDVLDRPMDDFLDFALWRALRRTAPYWTAPEQVAKLEFPRSPEKLLYAVNAVGTPPAVQVLIDHVGAAWPAEKRREAVALIARYGTPVQLGKLLEQLVDSAERDPRATAEGLSVLARETARRRTAPAAAAKLVRLAGTTSAELRTATYRAIAAWPAAIDSTWLALAEKTLADTGQPLPVRRAALAILAAADRPGRLATLRGLARRSGDPLRLDALRRLLPLAPFAAAETAADWLAEMGRDDDPAAVLRPFLSRPQAMDRLAEILSKRTIHADVAKRARRLAASGGQRATRLKVAFARAGSLEAQRSWKLTPEQMRALVQRVQQAGDPARGEAVYRRNELQCVKCHAIAGAGGRVGPDLISIGASAPVDYLIESLVEPNKKIKENFHSLLVVDIDGKLWSGIPVRRNDKELVLRDAEGRLVTLAVDDIEEMKQGQSLMPTDAVAGLTEQELVDLVRFLSQLGKPGPYGPTTRHLARRWEVLQATPQALRRLNRTSFDLAAADDPAWTWNIVWSRVAGELPLNELPTLKPHRETPPTTFLRTEVEVTKPGKMHFRLAPQQHAQCWIDGKPRPVSESMVVELSGGRHRLTFAIDRSRQDGALLVEWLPDASTGELAWRLGE